MQVTQRMLEKGYFEVNVHLVETLEQQNIVKQLDCDFRNFESNLRQILINKLQ